MNTRKREISSLEGEIWKDINGYEGIYKISSYGRVMSLERNVKCPLNGVRHIQSRIISNNIDKKGYHYTHLIKNGTRNRMAIHRLVALAFIPNPYNYPQIDHIDTNPSNNHISNLRWCTSSMNQMNPLTRTKRSLIMQGRFNGKCSTPIVKLLNGVLIEKYPSIAEANREGFQQQNIMKCCKGMRKTHAGFEWMYLSDYENLINKSKNESSDAES